MPGIYSCPRNLLNAERQLNAPESRRRLACSRKAVASQPRKRRTKAFLAEVRRQCRLANKADRQDDWQQYV